MNTCVVRVSVSTTDYDRILLTATASDYGCRFHDLGNETVFFFFCFCFFVSIYCFVSFPFDPRISIGCHLSWLCMRHATTTLTKFQYTREQFLVFFSWSKQEKLLYGWVVVVAIVWSIEYMAHSTCRCCTTFSSPQTDDHVSNLHLKRLPSASRTFSHRHLHTHTSHNLHFQMSIRAFAMRFSCSPHHPNASTTKFLVHSYYFQVRIIIINRVELESRLSAPHRSHKCHMVDGRIHLNCKTENRFLFLRWRCDVEWIPDRKLFRWRCVAIWWRVYCRICATTTTKTQKTVVTGIRNFVLVVVDASFHLT